MKHTKILLLSAVVALCCNSFSSSAQVWVTIRPPRPHYVRVVAPSPRHVWIDEDWTLRGGQYVWNGGRWALPPHPGMVWVPGHWRHRPGGDFWVGGHWR
jgi:hypothetical protein